MKIKKADRRIKRTRKLLKDSLIDLLTKKDFVDISITEIVHVSDLNRSTFYAHFQDKEDLLTCLITDLIDGLIKSIAEPSIFSEITNKERQPCQQAAVQLFTYVADHAVYFKTMLNEQRVPQFTHQLSNQLHDFYMSEMDKHSNSIVMDKGFFACYLTSVVIGFIYHWLIHTNMKYTPHYIAEELIKALTLKPYLPSQFPTKIY